MNKFFNKIIGASLAIAMMIGVGIAATNEVAAETVYAETEQAFSFSRSGSKDSVTSGYSMVLTNYKGNPDNYQDKNGTVGLDIGVKKTTGTMWSTTPTSISLTVKVGAGSAKNSLTNNVIANLINAAGQEIEDTSVIVTTKVENASGKDYTVSIPVANNAAGVMIHHKKESSYNVKIYSFSLSYEAVPEGTCTVTYNLNYDGAPTPTTNTVTSGGYATAPTTAPTRPDDENNHYQFAHWSSTKDGDAFDFDNTAISEDATLYAVWDVVPKTAIELIKQEKIETQAALSYSFVKEGDGAEDELTKTTTGVESTSYTSWSGKTGASGAVYAGCSAAGNNSIQLRSKNSDSGIITTTSGGTAKKVTVVWNGSTSNGNSLDVYGKNSAYAKVADLYDSSKQGTKIGSIVNGQTTSLDITGDYAYIGLRSNSGAIYLDSISIQWGESKYTYSNVAIRFGGQISKARWEQLDAESTIQGYGVMLSNKTDIETVFGEVKNSVKYDEVFNPVSEYSYNPLGDTGIKVFYNASTTSPAVLGNYYIWNLYKGINNTDKGLVREYTAVAFIKTANDDVVFLNETTKSAAKLAKEKVANDSKADESLQGSLSNLAKLLKAN